VSVLNDNFELVSFIKFIKNIFLIIKSNYKTSLNEYILFLYFFKKN